MPVLAERGLPEAGNMKLRFRTPADVKERIRLPYSCSAEDLQRQIEKRRGSAGISARDKALASLKTTWGIDAGALRLSGIWLPRQLARPDGEAFVTAALAQMSGVPAGILELTLDSYVDCAYKRSFTKQIFLSEEKGSVFAENYPSPAYGTSLDELKDNEGGSLVRSLRGLTRESLGNIGISDISGFYSEILVMNLSAAQKGAACPIPGVMVKSGGKIREFILRGGKYGFCDSEYSFSEMSELAGAGLARPSATWNYENVYLLIPGILCPEAALLVTPFELDPVKIQSAASAAIRRMVSELGLAPLLIPMIPMSLADTASMARAKSKLGKYPEFVNYQLSRESASQALGCGSGDFIDTSLDVAETLAGITARKEIKAAQEKRR